MPTPSAFLFRYIYRAKNMSKMTAAHILQPLIAVGNTALPLTLYRALENLQAGDSPAISLALSAGILSSNILLPRLHGYLIDSVRNSVQKDITVDMVARVYDKEFDTLLGSSTGACAVMVSKNYGTVGDVMPTFYSSLTTVLEVTAISYLLARWYGWLPGCIPMLGLSGYIATSLYLERGTEGLKKENSLLKIRGFTSILSAINNYLPAHQFGKTNQELGKLRGDLTTLEDSYTDLDRVRNVHEAMLSVVKQVPLVLLTAGILYQQDFTAGSLFTKEFLLSLYYLQRFSSLVDHFSSKINVLSNGLVDTRMLRDFMVEQSGIPDPKKPLNFKLTAAPKISFRNVSFSYPGSQSKNLSDLSFTVEPGQKVVLMGSTGCGKTTLLKLIQRFYAFDGTIEINGIDITQVRKKDLREGLAVISQETGLMEGTLSDNIKYGDPRPDDESNKDNNEEKIVYQAAEYAGLRFEPSRFFNPVKQQGLDFSGGERQRVNIAKFLLRTKLSPKSKIFLMDEPTAALDRVTASGVTEVLDQLAQCGTTIMITHDPALAANADQIFYLKDGKIIEKGTFSQLMELEGYFYDQILEQCRQLQIDVGSIRPNQSRKTSSDNGFLAWKTGSSPSMER